MSAIRPTVPVAAISGHEHTGTGAATASHAPALVERKIKPDGSFREYTLAPVVRLRHLVVGRFALPSGAAAGPRIPFGLPPGSCSDGYFWSRRPYVVYRFRGPDGLPVGHRADAVANVRLGRTTVTYRDLALDWWMLPGGQVLEEDRDELEQLVASGLLSITDAARADRARRMILGRWAGIVAEMTAVERSARVTLDPPAWTGGG